MNWQLLRLPWLIAERRSSAVFGIAIIAMLWAGIGIKHAEDVLDDRHLCERNVHALAMVAEEDVLRSIGEIARLFCTYGAASRPARIARIIRRSSTRPTC
jgi:hypothetical protein